MATVTNKVTGKTYPVTNEELKEIRNNPLTSGAFSYSESPLPEAVKKFRESQGAKTSTETQAEQPQTGEKLANGAETQPIATDPAKTGKK